jgi:hypothetical protein
MYAFSGIKTAECHCRYLTRKFIATLDHHKDRIRTFNCYNW